MARAPKRSARASTTASTRAASSWRTNDDALRLAQDTHGVVAEDLADGPMREACFEQGVGEKRQAARVAELFRRHDEAIPIAAERGHVLPDDIDNVLEMLHDRGEPIAAHEARTEDDADDAPTVGNGAELIVSD